MPRAGGRSAKLWLVMFVVALTMMSAAGIGTGLAESRPPLGRASHDPLSGPAAPTATFPTAIRHVITVLLENENSGTVLSNGPFERYLATQYGYASNFYGVCHPSSGNYLALTSGASFQCGADSYNRYSTSNIADLVENAGLTWGAYMESMPAPCVTSNSGNYVVRHDPFVYYTDIVSNASRCDAHVVDFAAWNSAVSSGSIPNYVLITPNILNDGHDTNVGYADNWLKNWLTPLVNDSFFQSSVFFITYDESGSTDTGYAGLDGGKVYFAAVGPSVAAAATYAANASHYDLLATTEWLLGIGSTGKNDCSATFPPMKSLFVPSSSHEYPLWGLVSATDSGRVIVGATVEAGCGLSATTNSTGGYALSLANGTYTIWAAASGFESTNRTVVVKGATSTQNFELRPNPAPTAGPLLTAWAYLMLGTAAVAAVSGGLYAMWRHRHPPPRNGGQVAVK